LQSDPTYIVLHGADVVPFNHCITVLEFVSLILKMVAIILWPAGQDTSVFFRVESWSDIRIYMCTANHAQMLYFITLRLPRWLLCCNCPESTHRINIGASWTVMASKTLPVTWKKLSLHFIQDLNLTRNPLTSIYGKPNVSHIHVYSKSSIITNNIWVSTILSMFCFIESVDSICRVSKDTQYTTIQLHYCTREFRKPVAMAVSNNQK